MSQLGDLLRESEDGNHGTRSERTMMLSLLEEDQIDGGDRTMSKWSVLKQRLRFDWVGCCGKPLTLRFRQSETPIVVDDDDDDEEEENETQNRVVDFSGTGPGTGPGTGLDCLTRGATRNLAEALAEERLAHVTETSVAKVPLMRLLAETDGCDSTPWTGSDQVCCVCMGREKGAAFIPCGHTYCRVCSREIWMNRGKCPLCNRSIFDVLDLY